ncbi:30S ribosomal protein S4 [Candidatus Bathyarchaeota archaeon RBG_13_60_20]|jgi:small subunit ribosomal protein S4|nr:MAG: 30S ribosomal protein S4 [Candidatus Bathyarchaeota archaeon RBG_13_60_20]
MGDPKKKHKQFTTPRVPYDTEALMEDLRIIGAYGLRNKRELWKVHTELSSLRRRARELLSLGSEERNTREASMIAKLNKRGLVMENSHLEDVLNLSVEDLLERRLQTYIFRRGMAQSLFQARQLIAHGHVEIAGRKVTSPSYQVRIEDEKTLDFAGSSPMRSPDHPIRRVLEVAEAKAGGEVR